MTKVSKVGISKHTDRGETVKKDDTGLLQRSSKYTRGLFFFLRNLSAA